MADWNNQQPSRLMNFREWVPDKVCVALYLCFLIAFQFSNGFYFTTMAQLVGERALTMSDTRMMGQTVLTGLCFFFPLAFRLKSRFSNKTSLTIAAVAQLAINLLFPHVNSYALMLMLCYLGGFFRLYGTFECFSNLLPRITPTYNYAVFLSFVFFVVIGCVGVFDWLAVQIIYYYDWQHVHATAVGLCALVIILVQVTMRHYRTMPKLPLYGTDPFGMLLWSLFILSAIFAVSYGEELGWLTDKRIRIAIGASLLFLAAGLSRMNNMRHPFIEAGAFHCPNLLTLLVLFLFLDLFLGTQHVLQNTYTSSVLGFDQRTAAWLKWPEFIGAAFAALFCIVARTKMQCRLRSLTFWSMASMVAYLLVMCRLIAPALDISWLWLPSILIGFGHVGVFIALTVYAQAYCNFKYYFQVLCILGFMRMGVGDVIGIAVWERALSASVGQHIATIGMYADVASTASATDFSQLATSVSNEALLVALRELYGKAALVGVALLLLMLIAQVDSLRAFLNDKYQAVKLYVYRKRALLAGRR